MAALAGGVTGGLSATAIRNTQLVEIGYTAHSPEMAARLANGYAEAYIDWGLQTQSETVGKASSFLSSQIEAIKQEIQDKESQLQAYSRRTDIMSMSPDSNVILQRLTTLNKDYAAAVSARINTEASYRQLAESPPESLADTLGGGLVGQLRSEQLKLEREYANKLLTFKPEWPAMVELKAQIDRGRQNLQSVVQETVAKARETAKTEYETALRREQSLAAELSRQKSEAMQLNSAAVEYNNLQVEVSTRRTLLNELVRRQSETEVASRLQGTRDSNITIVDRALVPGGHYRPSLKRNLAFGLALGLGLGLGLVFLLEYLDRSVKTPDDVDRVMGLPTLAAIPDIHEGRDTYGAYRYWRGYGYGASGYGYGYGYEPKKRKGGASGSGKERPRPVADDDEIELIPFQRPRLPVSESYRALRTALLLSTAEQLKTIVVTSAVPGEGKTSTATNLAVVLAQLGVDVLLVDADLRKPRLHEIFKMSNRVGLVNALARKAELPQVLMPTAVPHLFMTPAGPTPPNPAELLASQRMHELIAQVSERFEYIIFDTPPVLPVTDASVLCAQTDGVLLCVGAGHVLKEDAAAGCERVALTGSKLLGVALNRFRLERTRYGKKRYSAYHYEVYGDSGAHEAPGATS